MKQGKRDQLIDLVISALLTNKKREKQWYLEELLEVLQPGSLDEMAEDGGLPWQPGKLPEAEYMCDECKAELAEAKG